MKILVRKKQAKKAGNISALIYDVSALLQTGKLERTSSSQTKAAFGEISLSGEAVRLPVTEASLQEAPRFTVFLYLFGK